MHFADQKSRIARKNFIKVCQFWYTLLLPVRFPPFLMLISSKISSEEFNQFIELELPFAKMFNISAVEIDSEAAVLCAKYSNAGLRPGGTIAGPVMMGLADAALYAVVIANIGMVALAVTTNLSINFLRKPGPGDLFCRAKVLKLGKRLAVCEASVYSIEEDGENVVAHVTGTYSIPPDSRAN